MIEQRTLGGRAATVSYMTSDFEPADKASAALIKVFFADGYVFFLKGDGALTRDEADAARLTEQCREPATGPGGRGGKFVSCGEGGGGNVVGYSPGEKATESGGNLKDVKNDWYDRNPHRDIPGAGKASEEAQGRLGPIGEKIGKEHGVEFLNPGIKTDLPRIQDKADERGGVNRVSDLFRAGFSVDNPAQADAIAKSLAKEYETAHEDWKTTPVGFANKTISIRDQNGMVGEIQIAEKGMWHGKGEVEKGGLGGHAKYKEAQKLEQGIKEGRSANPDRDRARINELNQQQKDIYGGVLRSYGSDWRRALKL